MLLSCNSKKMYALLMACFFACLYNHMIVPVISENTYYKYIFPYVDTSSITCSQEHATATTEQKRRHKQRPVELFVRQRQSGTRFGEGFLSCRLVPVCQKTNMKFWGSDSLMEREVYLWLKEQLFQNPKEGRQILHTKCDGNLYCTFPPYLRQLCLQIALEQGIQPPWHQWLILKDRSSSAKLPLSEETLPCCHCE